MAGAVRWPLRRVLVTGPSMAPTLRHGDQVLVWFGALGTPRAGSVVVVRLPDRPLSVKRLTGHAPDGSVVVTGDNPDGSTDSRTLGPLPAGAVVGRVVLRLWPRPGRLRAPSTGTRGSARAGGSPAPRAARPARPRRRRP